jgi:hypothetical protein
METQQRAKIRAHQQNIGTVVQTEEDRLCDGLKDPGSCALIIVNSLPDAGIAGLHIYEERNLWNLMRLRNPHVKLLFLTSHILDEKITAYHSSLIASDDWPKRLFFWSSEELDANDPSGSTSHTPLAKKITDLSDERWERFAVMIQNFLKGTQRAFMKDFLNTNLEEHLFERLRLLHPALRLIACSQDVSTKWGSKEGSRQVFDKAGVMYPTGTNHITKDLDVLSRQIFENFDPRDVRKVVVKHNHGASGMGNAEFKIRQLPFAGKWTVCKSSSSRNCTDVVIQQIRGALTSMDFPPGTSSDSFLDKIKDMGAIVEAWVDPVGEGLTDYITSPSVQGFAYPVDVPGDGVDVLSTHEQILDGQVYLGGVSPAMKVYNSQMVTMGMKVGSVLRSLGVNERFAVDTVVQPRRTADGKVELTPFAIEINIRWGGTTAANEVLKRIATSVEKFPSSATYAVDGTEVFYVSTDNCKSPKLKTMSIDDLLVSLQPYLYPMKGTKGRGVTLHMLGGMQTLGKIGFAAYGHTRSEAHELYAATFDLLGAAHEHDVAIPDDA